MMHQLYPIAALIVLLSCIGCQVLRTEVNEDETPWPPIEESMQEEGEADR